jgi:ketosteroid isomerase-like protein
MRRLILVAVSLLIASWLAASAAAQGAEQSASQSKVIALENAWNQAEERKDARALDTILDSSLVYTDYDGSMMNKADFLASVKSPSRHPEQQVTESMNARVYGDAAVVTGVYRVRGTDNGKPYLRRGRFTDTWINRYGNWVCVASQFTLITK